MSEFFNNNKTAIHIASEVLVFGISMFVIYRKTNTLSGEIRELDARVRDLENIVIEQKKIITQIMSATKNINSSKNYSTTPIIYTQIPSQFNQPAVHIQSSNSNQSQPTPAVHIQSSNSNRSQPTLATIVEIEEDELDKSLEEELKELKN